MTGQLLCVGMGYSARALAQRLGRSDWHVSGTATTAAGVDEIAVHGWKGTSFDGTGASSRLAAMLASASHLLVSAPPGRSGDPLLRWHAGDIENSPSLRWIGYLSTVGVYGDHQGRWVTETTPVAPQSPRSRERADAECAWLDLAARTGKRAQVFRLPGIYGPGRSAVDALRAGTARRIIKPGQVFNRIHVADIANVLAAAIATPQSQHRIFNLADDEPAPAEDVVEYAAQILDLPVPPAIALADAGLSPMAASFYSECKRVSNALMKSELGVTLAYPTYREGIAAIAGSA